MLQRKRLNWGWGKYGLVGSCQRTEFIRIRLCACTRFGLGDGPYPKHAKPRDCVNLMIDRPAFFRTSDATPMGTRRNACVIG